jgi:excisionase family DNA binding protein
MPVSVENTKFYRITEACNLAGISRETFLRWVREGSFSDVKYRDFRGWRLFTDEDLARLKTKVERIVVLE